MIRRNRLDMPKIVASQNDWIKLGYQLFSSSGIMGINVDQMSKLLKCNKSSFYWHFKTKDEFIDRIIAHWISSDTHQIIKLVDTELSGRAKFENLVKISFKKDAHLDFVFFLKRYARKNKKITKLIDQIDAERINYVVKLLIEMKYPKKEASIKAQIFYKYLIGYHEMIRYKKQEKDYYKEVMNELNHFIKIK